MAGRSTGLRAAAVLAVGLIASAAAAASAAERVCKAPMTGAAAVATTQGDAHMAARASWRMKTLKAHGKAHANWELAVEKITKCQARNDGGFECVATARPCAVRNANPELGI